MFNSEWEPDDSRYLHDKLFCQLKARHLPSDPSPKSKEMKKSKKQKKNVALEIESAEKSPKISRKKSKNKYAHLIGVSKYDVVEKQKAELRKCDVVSDGLKTNGCVKSDAVVKKEVQKKSPKVATDTLGVQKLMKKKSSKAQRCKTFDSSEEPYENGPVKVNSDRQKEKKKDKKLVLEKMSDLGEKSGVSLGKRKRLESDVEIQNERPRKQRKSDAEVVTECDNGHQTKLKKKKKQRMTEDVTHSKSEKLEKKRDSDHRIMRKKKTGDKSPQVSEVKNKKLKEPNGSVHNSDAPRKEKKKRVEETLDTDFNKFKSEQKAGKLKAKTQVKKTKTTDFDSKSNPKRSNPSKKVISEVIRNSANSHTDSGIELEEDVEKTKPKTVASKATKTLREKLVDRLQCARFRYINEQLYTCAGDEALELMTQDRSAFEVYHSGFQAQVNKWPLNPVTLMINYVKARPLRDVIADFGCGEAQISVAVQHKVHSFDLVALNSRVTPCDMAHVPLTDSSVNVSIFCLSLMGTNITDFLSEASRVLKPGGVLLIAEVISRFDKVSSFVRKMRKMGFELKNKNLDNKMFVWFEFTKVKPCPSKSAQPHIELHPCQYKRR